ncbi:MAG: PAS domain-containing sensor histidine kinase [Candidatus Peribacteraceae bacterium]|jgi:signal transduction histidine kinase
MEIHPSPPPDAPAFSIRALVLAAVFFLFMAILWLLPHVRATPPPFLVDLWQYGTVPTLLAALLLTHRYMVRPTLPRFVLAMGTWISIAAIAPLLLFAHQSASIPWLHPQTTVPAMRAWLPFFAHLFASATLLGYALSFHRRWNGCTFRKRPIPMALALLLPPFLILCLWLAVPFPPQLPSLGILGSGPELLPFLLNLAAFAFLLWRGTWLHDSFENSVLWLALLQQAAITYLLFSFGADTNAAALSSELWMLGSLILPITAELEMLTLERAAEQYRAHQRLSAAHGSPFSHIVPPPEAFSFASQQTEEALYILNENGRIAFANDAFLRLMNDTPSGLLDHGPDEWLEPPRNGKTFQQQLAYVRNSKKPLSCAMVQKRRDGSRFSAALSLAPVPGEFGEPQWFVVRTSDIGQVDEQVLVLRQILDNMPLGICLVEAESLRLLQSNSFAETLFSRLQIPAPATLHDIHRLFRTAEGTPYPEGDIPALTTKRTNEECMKDGIVVTSGVGTPMTWRVHSIPLFDAAGVLHTILVSMDDVTGRHVAEHDMTDYVSIVAHQLRTPLTAMKWSLLQLRKYKEMPPADVDLLVQTSAEASDAMFRVVQNILELVKIESKQLRPTIDPTDLAAIIKQTVQELTPQITAKKITVNQSAIGSVPSVPSDTLLLKQALVNLLENAVKYTPAGGVIQSILSVEKGMVHWILHDSGIGVPREALPHLFTKFWRAENAQKTDAYGLGLGLFTVRLILTILGGKVECESELGKGTAFHVYLPLTAPKASY